MSGLRTGILSLIRLKFWVGWVAYVILVVSVRYKFQEATDLAYTSIRCNCSNVISTRLRYAMSCLFTHIGLPKNAIKDSLYFIFRYFCDYRNLMKCPMKESAPIHICKGRYGCQLKESKLNQITLSGDDFYLNNCEYCF